MNSWTIVPYNKVHVFFGKSLFLFILSTISSVLQSWPYFFWENDTFKQNINFKTESLGSPYDPKITWRIQDFLNYQTLLVNDQI